jgi:hypothetical protein
MCTLGSLGLVAGMVGAPAPALAHDVDPADFQQLTLAPGVAEVGEPMATAELGGIPPPAGQPNQVWRLP